MKKLSFIMAIIMIVMNIMGKVMTIIIIAIINESFFIF